MPSRNIVKTYIASGYYHVYNRGVEKRDIFLDKQDCVVFQRYLKLYLATPEEVARIQIPRVQTFLQYNMHDEIDLLSFSLMPNHIHLEIKQRDKDSIAKLMKRLTTSYVMYFNRKYRRIGPLFQNIYKAAHIDNETYLLHLSRYIHLNPIKIKHKTIDFTDFCSMPYYMGDKKASWVKTEEVLSYFQSSRMRDKNVSYKEFVEGYKTDPRNILGSLIIEDEDD